MLNKVIVETAVNNYKEEGYLLTKKKVETNGGATLSFYVVKDFNENETMLTNERFKNLRREHEEMQKPKPLLQDWLLYNMVLGIKND